MPRQKVNLEATADPWIQPLLLLIQKAIDKACDMRREESIGHRDDCECSICRTIEYLQQAKCQAYRIEQGSHLVTKRG